MTCVETRARPQRRQLNRLGRRRGPTGPERVCLRDGSSALVRPVESTDIPLLIDGFSRLSARSRQMRFLIGKNELSAKELRYFTDVDHHDHEALCALDAMTGRGIGIARFIRSAGDPLSADVAVTVVDEWQGRGLGTELMSRLAQRARDEGIWYFNALVAADNRPVLGLMRRMEADVDLRGYQDDTVEYEISLRVRERSSAGHIQQETGTSS